MSAPSTLFVASISFASEYGSTRLCLSRSVALYILFLGRFGSHSTPADRAAAVDPPPFLKKDDEFVVNENSIFYYSKTVVFEEFYLCKKGD